MSCSPPIFLAEWLGLMKKREFPWILKVGLTILALFARVTYEDKVESPSSDDLFCMSDCATCPVICSPPPPPPPPPLTPSTPHSPPPLSYFTFSPPPPHKSQSPPPPPSKPLYNTPPSSSGPHDYYYPYYYFYASVASPLSIHAPFIVLLLFLVLVGYSLLGKW